RRRKRREPDLWKQAIDIQLIGRNDVLLVEQPDALDLVAPRDADVVRQAPRDSGAGALAREVEARSNLLLERARQVGIRRGVEQPRLAKGALNPVLRESVAVPRRGRRLVGKHGRILRAQADAREEIDRSVLAPQIA